MSSPEKNYFSLFAMRYPVTALLQCLKEGLVLICAIATSNEYGMVKWPFSRFIAIAIERFSKVPKDVLG